MFRKFKERKENFRRLLEAAKVVAEEYRMKSYGFWKSQKGDNISFSRNIDGIEMRFVIDWFEQKDGGLFIDIMTKGNLPTNFGAQPRDYFVVYKDNGR